MSILTSVCLVGINCRYDGGNCLVDQAMKLVTLQQMVPLCPEQLGGLSNPRSSADICSGSGEDVLVGISRVLTEDGEDVSSQFIRGVLEALKIARLFKIHKALLKQRSPSYGCGQICRGGRVVDGDGVAAAVFRRRGIEVFPL